MDDSAANPDAATGPDRAGAVAAASTVLVADGRPAALGAVARGLANDGHRVLVGCDAGAALDLLAHERPEMALLHHDLLGVDGGLIRNLRSLSPGLPILVYGCRTGSDRWPHQSAAQGIGAVGVDGDDPVRLRELVMSALLATRCVGRLRDEYELRSRLLSQLCQTLRAPLHVIQGYAELLHDAPATPATYAALAGLAGAAANALRLTAEHVAVADLDASVPDAQCEPIELDALLGELRHAAARPDSGHPVRLLASAPFPGAVIHADANRLRVLLAHLVLRTGLDQLRRTVRLRVRGTALGTRFEFTASSGRAAGATPAGGNDESRAAAIAADGPAGDAGWAIAQRLCSMLGASIATHRKPPAGTVIMLDLPTHLVQTPATSGRSLLH